MVRALHARNHRAELKAKFLRDLPPPHALTAHREDALQIGCRRRSRSTASGRLRDRAAGERSLQLLRRRLGNAERVQLLFRECQRNINVAKTHVARGRRDHGRRVRGNGQAARS